MTESLFKSITEKLNFSLRKKTPVILQSEAAECGIACLAMISGFYGLNIDLFNFRQRYGSPSQGVTLLSLSKTGERAGLKSRALSLDIDEIKQLKLPCIIHWGMNHYVVLTKVRKSSFIIHDPALGKRVIGMQEMSNYFTGVALEIWPDQNFQQEQAKSRLRLLDLMRNIVGLKSTLIKIFAFSVVIEAIGLLLPVGTQMVTDHVIMAQDQSLLTVICIGLVSFTLFRTFISMLRAWTSLTLNTLTNIQWQTTLFDHLTSLPLSFFEKRHLGDIQSRFSSLDVIRSTFTNSIVTGIIDTIMTIGLLIMLTLYGGWLVWIVIGFTLCYAIMRLATYRFYRRVSEEQVIKGARSSSHFMESLYGIATIKALNLKERRSQNWLNLNIDACNAGIKQTRFDMMFSGINTLISSIDQVVILWVGALAVIDNNMTLGMFMAFNAYRGQFSQRASSLIDLFMQLRMLSLHNERLSEIVFTEPESEMPPRRVFEQDKGVKLEVKNLSYQYDAFTQPVFSNLNIIVEPGESVALVGPSGVGKTTLLKVMCGLLSPTSGDVLADELDINKIGLNNYRLSTACVLQEDRLFSGSISENICGFEDNPDEAFIIECARHSNIHDEIMKMPMGYETIIGELGTGISGGQKQRLLIARALYRKPGILFMDEATSHLDLNNEANINHAISNLSITRIIVAHRPSTIASADRVINLSTYSSLSHNF
ncbi:peptidase domain-containing ABC transporter [Klebsiella oxytoca]|uniref:peptidase domain-containing ABC transporter n=1 Tax=Klebsiella oxytoca TaxID=571 RepID=UPI00066DA4D8|nr:peptidase domain-containing ABC transporter [Klebsiella oxytoca]EKT8242250.1 peptidase domain-containing ABC transporter [Klebsiella oxytoca]EKT9459770.1 peptidase domain-containing ABC transporter [Klebsiella oxytoca]ELC8313923.1 peptidase domain-containing ABC transporter [Klebsiella oxytoca]ELI6940515.1 peptidase domain-containing ABC transporter [Klebsiella oxytoca]ELK0756371.1 peptidase domain-containing ABC transporter [Klebsiella oxytoca]